MKGRGLTNVVGALIEAWEELRIHKLRVLLSLVGVAVAVGAMTFVLGLGQILGQASSEMMEQMMGRQVTLLINANKNDGSSDERTVVDAYRAAEDRFDIEYASVVAQTQQDMRATRSVTPMMTLVDPDYQVIHRRAVEEGRFLEAGDVGRRAPALVVNQTLATRAGLPPLDQHPTVTIPGDPGFTAVVVGIMADSNGQWTEPEAIALYDSWQAALSSGGLTADTSQMGGPPMFEAWVDPDDATKGTASLLDFVTGRLGPDWSVAVNSNESTQFGDLTGTFSAVVLGVGILVLALGALSLVNITLVTVKYRVREIGIRRSFGATSGRVFFSIMLESVVATAVAGIIGVGLAVWAVPLVPFAALTGMPIQDVPPFPMSMALVGLAAATLVGALAGLLPALYAVRIRPVDAIRA